MRNEPTTAMPADPRAVERAQRVLAVNLVDDLLRGTIKFDVVLFEVAKGHTTAEAFARAVNFFAAT